MNTKPFPTTNQEAFNNVWKHFVTEKNPRAYDGILQACKYRVEIDGKTCGCAIGCQIPDEIYKEKFEGVNVLYLMFHNYISFHGISRILLNHLQDWHDNSFDNIDRLRHIANMFNLVIPSI